MGLNLHVILFCLFFYFVLIFIAQLRLSPFSPITLPCPPPPPHSVRHPLLPLFMGRLYLFLDLTRPLPSGHCLSVPFFRVSGSILLACSF